MYGVIKRYGACLLLFCLFAQKGVAQDTIHSERKARPYLHHLRFSGQGSGWLQYAPDSYFNLSAGGRYIPQLNYKIPLSKGRLFDFEASANINGIMDAHLFDDTWFDYEVKGYRLWARYSENQMELRVGLQKINFGSAQMLRPLMWFDRIDPRDPLMLTDGVKAALWRYYFLNNANIWIWGLYGNNKPKGYEFTLGKKEYPEAGGRLQLPIPKGEAALTYHYRVTDPKSLFFPGSSSPYEQVGEHKVGFDFKINTIVGIWLETSWTRFNRELGVYTNQEMVTVGADYTFGLGNGLTTTLEHFTYAYDQKAFRFNHTTTLSAFALSYPINAFDNIRAIAFYHWKEEHGYLFLTWQKQLNRFSFYLMGYWNPKIISIPGMRGDRFAGKGLQVMVVWNH